MHQHGATRNIVLLIRIVLGLLIASSLLGCNTQGKSEASDILNKSISKMSTLSSFKETDLIVASTKEGTSTTTQKAEYDLSTKKSHAVRTEDNRSTTTTYYAYGGHQYVGMSVRGNPIQWQKLKTTVTGAGAYWLTEITKMAKNPKSVRVVSENSATYELGLDAKQQLVNLMLNADVATKPKATNDPKQAATVKAVENLKATVVFAVAKDTFYLERAYIKIDIAAMPDTGDLSLKEDFRFYDFNKPVNIVLPEDAKSAGGK